MVVLMVLALVVCMTSGALAQAVVDAPAGVVAAAPDLACTDVPCEHVIALATTAHDEEGALIDLHRAATTATSATSAKSADKELNLSDPRFEVGPVVSVAPKRTGTGAAVSWRFAANADRTRGVWADLGGMRWDRETLGFIGLSTNIPIGGQTLKENGRIGGGVLSNGSPFGYTRAALKF